MKKQLLKKLSAFIVTAIMFSATASAQIVYTDVIPDVTKSCTGACTKTDTIDINNDGVFDLKLVLTKSGGSGSVKATPLNGCAILNNSGFPDKLYRNDSINPNSNWISTANQILRSVSYAGPQGNFNYSGNWGPQIDGFLGIRINTGSDINYGWIRLNIAVSPQSASYTYKEFALNSIPDQAILAGQTSDTIIITPIVNIPDAAFKIRLVNNAAINTDIDREIQVTEAAAFTGQLNVSSGSISDLTGIEAFTALTYLNCGSNNLTSLDFSANTALTFLNCGYNELTSLNVSANAALETLYCQNNQFTNIDVSANNALFTFNCSNNLFISIDVSSNLNLGQFYCNNNQLTNLDFSSNTLLETLYCNNNHLTSLNFLNSVDYLECEYNQLTSLDVSANTALWRLLCNNNQLTSLNVKNGNNINFNAFDARNNPNLFCIEVDNVAYSNANWSAGKDATASFSTNCGFTSVNDIDKSATVQIFPNPANGFVTVDGLNNIQKIELINIQGQIVKTILVNDNSSLIDVSSISNGIYQLKLSSSNQSKTERLVVVH